MLTGAVGGWLWWRHLSRMIARRDRRYERNKIFVHYLSIVEVAIAAVAYNHYLALPLGVVLLAVVVGTSVFSHAWIMCLGSSGLVGMSVLAGPSSGTNATTGTYITIQQRGLVGGRGPGVSACHSSTAVDAGREGHDPGRIVERGISEWGNH